MNILPLPRGHLVRPTREWITRFVRAVWGIELMTFQMDDLEALVQGGIFAVMYPTDHGKSMLLEMTAVLRLAIRPNRRIVVIKINDSAAQETAQEICRRLLIASQLALVDGEYVEDIQGDEDNHPFRYLRPIHVRWDGEIPVGTAKGFDIEGIQRIARNVNRSVRCYGIGSRDLQGKRGDTLMDDIERQEEAKSEAYRDQLETRVSAVLRTLESDDDSLWAAFGTPTHEESIYYSLPQKLRDTGLPHQEIYRPIRNDDGTLLWPERARKVEVHRRLMTKTEWNAAYELRPTGSRKMTKDEIEELVRDRSMPWIENEKQMAEYLLTWALGQRPPTIAPLRWRREIQERLREVAFYTVWDPAGTGDWGVGQICVWGRNMWGLRARLAVGDSVEQLATVRSYYLDFPSSSLVLEKNGQQKAFKDMARMDRVLKYAPILDHATFSNKHDEKIGVPGFMSEVKSGRLRLPYGDPERAEEEFGDLENEMTRYGPTSHPHILVAYWFGWYYHRRHQVKEAIEAEIERRQVDRETAPVKVEWGGSRPTMSAPARMTTSRASTRAAWSRRHR